MRRSTPRPRVEPETPEHSRVESAVTAATDSPGSCVSHRRLSGGGTRNDPGMASSRVASIAPWVSANLNK